MAIRKIRKLYLIVDRMQDLTPEQKQQQRQTLSKPLLEDFHHGWRPIKTVFPKTA